MTIKHLNHLPSQGPWPQFEKWEIMGNPGISLQEEDPNPTVFKMGGSDIVVKLGPHVHQGEYDALCLLYEQGLPVPEPFYFGRDHDTGFYYILMRYIEGQRLTDVWDFFDQEVKASILSQLGDFVIRMRENTASYIGSLGRTVCNDNFLAAPFQPSLPSVFNGASDLGMKCHHSNPVCNDVLAEDRQWYGPFNDNKDFVEMGIIHYLRERGRHEQTTELVVQMIREMPDSPGPYILTHGEITPDNILVRNGKVVAVLDWNQAGYYPEYWEYVKAHFWQYENCNQMDYDIPVILEPHVAQLSILLHAKRIIW